MKNLKNSDGFSAVHVLLVLVIVGIVGFTGWYVWNTNKDTSKQLVDVQDSSAQTQKNDQSSALSKKYTDTVGEFSVNYPSSWKLAAKHDSSNADNVWSSATLTSPGGTELSLRSDFGGKGGDCTPEAGDKPFAAGNQCPTYEYLSAELAPINNLYYADDVQAADGTTKSVYKKTNIQLVSGHYADTDGNSQYTIGLVDSDPQHPVSVGNPSIGFLTPEDFFTVMDSSGVFHRYIYATASGKDESFLTSKDAITVKAILRTLSVNL